MKYYYLLFIVVFTACSTNNTMSTDSKKGEFFSCAVFENGGTHLILSNRIKSYNELIYHKQHIQKNFPDHTANYYNVVEKTNKVVLHGYDIETNTLMEMSIANKAGMLLTRTTYSPTGKIKKTCKRKYIFASQKLIAKESCTDSTSKIIEYYKDNKNNFYSLKTIRYFQNRIFIQKLIASPNGYHKIYDRNNKIIREYENIEPSDGCTPFSLHLK